MVTLSNAEAAAIGNIRLPRDVYTIRCIDAQFKISPKKQTPLISLTWEIESPETIKGLNIKGMKVTNSYFLTEKAIGRLVDLHLKLNLPVNVDINESDEVFMSDFCKQYIGKRARAILYSKENIQRKEVITEDGSIRYEPMLDENGQPIVSYWPEIDTIIKGVTTDING